ncbi:uncharacterized protein LOC115232387 isoform X3 [Octopus sinensis]|uniref:Uncharacterized protein LOC115232387 isoform X3 n=1 Tax=Octopus sinensis TaxID=2607531 RepID=A0A6P7U088_9MOLL|nr:uncharacterized protein LOC115232387 isoform X3 [Octopus sinensis]
MDCCLYYYKNERDKEPKGKYPLYGYNTVHRAGDESSNWTFVINHSDSTCKKIKFSASSQYEMVEWMRRIKAEMLKANNRPIRSLPEGSSAERVDFPLANINSIEEAIYDDISIEEVIQTIPDQFKISCDGDSDNESETPRPLPETPSQKRKLKAKGNLRVPDGCASKSPAEKGASPSYVPTMIISDEPPTTTMKAMVDDYWKAFEFNGPKEVSMKLLTALEESGAYMVRESENKVAPKTLLVYCAELKRTQKYQIFYESTPKPKYYLKKGIEFNSLEELIYHYFYHSISNEYESKLLTPYTYIPNWEAVLEKCMQEEN